MTLCALLCITVAASDAGSKIVSRRGIDWPKEALASSFTPQNPGYRKMLKLREEHVMKIDVKSRREERWEAWNQLCSQVVVGNFTDAGYKVVDLPKEVYAKVKQHFDENYENRRDEHIPLEMDGVLPKFVHNPASLNQYVLSELRALHEEWAGVKLRPSIAYGTRVYQRDNTLAMHIDVIETHVISSILPVSREHDDEGNPWPIEIEGFDGLVHQIDIRPGQILLYESAKCPHGRPKKFHGNFYAAMFVHYRPEDWAMTSRDHVACLPEYWDRDPVEGDEEFPAAQAEPHTRGMRGTAFDGDWFNYPEGLGGDEFFVKPSKHAANEL
jgi:hypothetical protein